MANAVESAQMQFSTGLSCSQAVFASLAPQLGLTEEQALKIASPFGGGLARRGMVCGAVSGALMAVGLKLGSTTPEGKAESYRIANDFLKQFEERHPSLLCRDLIGYDLSDPDARPPD